MKKFGRFMCLMALTAISAFYFAGNNNSAVIADGTAQTVPFSQNWTNTGLITANDNWSGVLGIEGYLGQDITAATAVDPQTLLTTSTLPNDLDVVANQINPNTVTSGGVAEFDAIADPTVALQGSGTADAPYVIIYLNTTGVSGVNVAYNVRDIDGSADNAIQQVALQYRVGSTGNFTNLPAGFIADATTGPSLATLVTPISVALPADANNQPVVQVRIITSNAAGSDEWVGIDDINITSGGGPTPTPTPTPGPITDQPVDMNGDGKSDWVVVRNIGGGPAGQARWFISTNNTGAAATFDWGTASDFYVPGDFDGDQKDDVAIWRPGTQSKFFILQSATQTVRTEDFGQTGDDPTIVADYNGDGKDDVAVYRDGVNVGDQSRWYYRPQGAANFTTVNWGEGGDTVVTGDYDGDGKADFVLQRAEGGQSRFFIRTATDAFSSQLFGSAGDYTVAGDYDGDGKTDLAVSRLSGGNWVWDYKSSLNGATVSRTWGTTDDIHVPGDYDGDGKTDYAVWRPGAQSTYYVLTAGTLNLFSKDWGVTTDLPVAAYNVR